MYDDPGSVFSGSTRDLDSLLRHRKRLHEYILTISTTPFDVSAAAAAGLDMMNVMNQNYCGYAGGNHEVRNIC